MQPLSNLHDLPIEAGAHTSWHILMGKSFCGLINFNIEARALSNDRIPCRINNRSDKHQDSNCVTWTPHDDASEATYTLRYLVSIIVV